MILRFVFFTIAVALLLLVGAPELASAQKRNARPAKNDGQPAAVKTAEPEPTPQRSALPPKRNERPVSGDAPAVREPQAVRPTYRYEFSQPEFTVSSIKIEHDDKGNGTIVFTKKGDEELISDPLSVSPKSLAQINEALTALNFLDSTEDYQYEKDYSHLGKIVFARTRDGKTREVKFNWTLNKNAKVLMDEYRRIANQYIWVFDVTLSRDNQPLDAPRLFDSLESMMRRNEISDPQQLDPFLRELSNDERIPLIARNHAARLVKQFEKEKEKEKQKADGGN